MKDPGRRPARQRMTEVSRAINTAEAGRPIESGSLQTDQALGRRGEAEANNGPDKAGKVAGLGRTKTDGVRQRLPGPVNHARSWAERGTAVHEIERETFARAGGRAL